MAQPTRQTTPRPNTRKHPLRELNPEIVKVLTEIRRDTRQAQEAVHTAWDHFVKEVNRYNAFVYLYNQTIDDVVERIAEAYPLTSDDDDPAGKWIDELEALQLFEAGVQDPHAITIPVMPDDDHLPVSIAPYEPQPYTGDFHRFTLGGWCFWDRWWPFDPDDNRAPIFEWLGTQLRGVAPGVGGVWFYAPLCRDGHGEQEHFYFECHRDAIAFKMFWVEGS